VGRRGLIFRPWLVMTIVGDRLYSKEKRSLHQARVGVLRCA